jgi:hypothetical protein
MSRRQIVAGLRRSRSWFMQPCEKTLILFLGRHLATGAVGALVFGGGLLVLDVANLRTLLGQSESGWIAMLLLFFGLFVTFGSVAMAIGIMSLGSFSEDGQAEDIGD